MVAGRGLTCGHHCNPKVRTNSLAAPYGQL